MGTPFDPESSSDVCAVSSLESELMDLDVFSLPSMPVSESEGFPSIHVVYFVVDGSDVLYVGRTVDLWARWANHHISARLAEYPDAVLHWLEMPSQKMCEKIETFMIHRFRPLLNTRVLAMERIGQFDSDIANLKCRINHLQNQKQRIDSYHKTQIAGLIAKVVSMDIHYIRRSVEEFEIAIKTNNAISVVFTKEEEQIQAKKAFIKKTTDHAIEMISRRMLNICNLLTTFQVENSEDVNQ